MSGDVVERICHKEQLGIWAGEIASILSLGEFLKDDWAFDDSVDLETELAAQLRDVVASALTHPEINVTDLITSQAAEIERLREERDEIDRVRVEQSTHLLRRAETAERLLAEARAALTPSAETKADYIGEFQFTVTMMELDESDEPYECQRMVTVPWTTVKEIMAAISARAARTLTNGGENGR